MSDICKVFSLSESTVGRYLRRGVKLGWCHYDGKEEFQRFHESYVMISSRNIYMSVTDLNTGIIDYYNSIDQLSKNSEEKYGFRMTKFCIKKYLVDNPYYYDGYYFKRISQEEFIKNFKKENI